MKIKPLYDRVLILPNSEENVTASGIVLPETSQERPQIGKVIAVGNGDTFDGENIPLQVDVGDKVLFSKYAGTEIKYNDKTHIILRQIDIIGIVEE